MAKSTTGYGVLLIVIGVVAYIATSMASVTALIPAFFGIVFAAIGKLGGGSKGSLIAALVLAVVGLFGSLSGIPQTVTLLTGGDVARPAASVARAVMAVVLIAMVFSLIRALRAARAS